MAIKTTPVNAALGLSITTAIATTATGQDQL